MGVDDLIADLVQASPPLYVTRGHRESCAQTPAE
jgi:hypothetical protein